MKKLIFAVLTALFVLSIKGYTKPPKISGNIEQGSRYAIPYDDVGFPTPWVEATESDAEETWAYNFHKGYLQLYHRLNEASVLSLKNDTLVSFFRAASQNPLHRKIQLHLEGFFRGRNKQQKYPQILQNLFLD